MKFADGRIRQMLRLAWAMPAQLRQVITLDQALARLRQQMASRDENFLAAAQTFIYENPSSPYRRMLHWAGCEFADLRRSVQTCGVRPGGPTENSPAIYRWDSRMIECPSPGRDGRTD